RLVLSNSRVPRSSSSERTCWLTTPGVTWSSSAALLKLSWRQRTDHSQMLGTLNNLVKRYRFEQRRRPGHARVQSSRWRSTCWRAPELEGGQHGHRARGDADCRRRTGGAHHEPYAEPARASASRARAWQNCRTLAERAVGGPSGPA